MKTNIQLLSAAVLGLILFLSNTAPQGRESSRLSSSFQVSADSVRIEYTGRIKAIIDKKCFDCHNMKSDDEEAKDELLWEELPKLSKMDQVSALDAIIESIEKGEMPPQKYVKKHPEAKLSAEEAKILIEWADKLADQLFE